MQGDLKQNKYIMNLPNSYVPSLLCIVLVCHGYSEFVFSYFKAVKLKFYSLIKRLYFNTNIE